MSHLVPQRWRRARRTGRLHRSADTGGRKAPGTTGPAGGSDGSDGSDGSGSTDALRSDTPMTGTPGSPGTPQEPRSPGPPGASPSPDPPGHPGAPGQAGVLRAKGAAAGHAGGAALRRTVAAFRSNELTDRAAALTYYGVLSLFPALLVLVSLLSLAGTSVTAHVVNDLELLVPDAAQGTVTRTVHQLQAHARTGSVLAVAGLLGSVWTASGYVAAFIRTANAVHRMPEGRGAWRVLRVRLGVTVALMVLACASALIVVFTGGVAERAGSALGVGDTALAVWSYAKWPVLVLLVTLMIAVLYRTTPNVRPRGARWVTVGSALALGAWMAASAGFALYVAHFGSYNTTYGTLAGVIVFLVWLWIGNLALLFGLTFDAELSSGRAGNAGAGAAVPRGTRTWSEADRAARDAQGERDEVARSGYPTDGSKRRRRGRRRWRRRSGDSGAARRHQAGKAGEGR
jgi:membrane protein